ncbi:MAG: multiheme c-type cytochrome, partial [Polyangiaceae bacterium]
MHAGYKSFLLILSIALAVSAAFLFRSESPVKKGGIVTRWRTTGDVNERCVVCHTEAHSEKAAAVIATHPIEKYGCVACHGGNATATDTSAHDGLFALKKKEGMLSDVALTEAACG